MASRAPSPWLSAAVWLVAALLGPSAFTQEDDVPPERFSDPPRPSPQARARETKLRQAVATTPDLADAWTNLGWRLYKDGRYGECEWVMGEARKRSPNDQYTLWMSGLSSYAMGHLSDAKRWLWQLWKDNKSWVDTVDMGITYDILGRVAFLEAHDLFQAAYFFSKAADEMPKNWQVRFLLGITEWYRGRVGESEKALEEAHQMRPRDPLIHRYFAWARVAADERDIAYTKRAAEQQLFPKAQEEARAAVARYAADADVIKKAIAAEPRNPDGLELLARYYISLGRNAEAIATLRQAVALDERDGSALYLLAKSILATPSPAARVEAKQLLLRSIAASPGYWEGDREAPNVGLLVAMLLEEGKVTEAQAITDWYVKQDAEQP